MTPDPLTFAHRWQRCGCAESPEAERGPNPQCVALAALIEARGREIRADECEQAAESLGDLIIRFAPRTIAGALRARATQHRGDTND